MNKPIQTTLLVALLARPSGAHEQEGHLKLTRDALKQAPRFEQVLMEVGIADLSYGGFEDELGGGTYVQAAMRALGNRFWISTSSPLGLVEAGSVLEDGLGGSALGLGIDVPYFPIPRYGEFSIQRCTNHFQDPSGEGQGVVFRAHAAQFWGYQAPENGFTWVQAVRAFEKGLLLEDPTERLKSLEHMFVALGCNLHLLQDQFSPAHTRNDAHPGHYLPGAEWTHGSSLLEINGARYLNPDSPHFRTEVVGLPSVATHRGLFARAVTYTNTHYFSDDTIFSLVYPWNYPHPLTTTSSPPCRVERQDDESAYVSSLMGATPGMKLARETTSEYMRMDGTTGIDFSWSLEGIDCDGTIPVPAIDRVIYDNLEHLVPEAVGFSAALLDHFFRGRIELAQEERGLRLTNRTVPVSVSPSEIMDGAFRQGTIMVVLEYPDGRREKILDAALPSGGLPPGGSMSISLPSIPAEAFEEGETTLVAFLSGGLVGHEAGVAARAIDWRNRCGGSTVCFGFDVYLLDGTGDLNSDGAEDLLMVHDRDTFFSGQPRVSALSMGSCEILWTALAGESYTGLVAARSIGDVDMDGVADVAWSVHSSRDNQLYIRVLSGSSGSTFKEFPEVPQYGSPFGGVSDLDGGGTDDIAAWRGVYSSESGNPLFRFGTDIDDAFDANGDGQTDFVFDGLFVDGARWTQFSLPANPDPSYYYSGFRAAFWIPSAGGDAMADLLATRGDRGDDGRELALLSGQAGNALWSLPFARHEGLIGHCGDFDGDGSRDVYALEVDPADWQVTRRIYSSLGTELLEQTDLGILTDDNLATFMLVPVADLDGDGRSDYLRDGVGIFDQGFQTCVSFTFASTLGAVPE